MKKPKRTHKWMKGDLVLINLTEIWPEYFLWSGELCLLGEVTSGFLNRPIVRCIINERVVLLYYVNGDHLTLISDREFSVDGQKNRSKKASDFD